MRSLRLLALVFWCGVCGAPVHAQCTDDVNSVARKIGLRVTFCGTPTGIKCAEHGGTEPVYIDFGGPYPQQSFSITLPANELEGCDRSRARLMGRVLRVEGLVDTLAGKPVMVLHDLGEIVFSDP